MPEIGEIAKAKDIGKSGKGNNFYIYLPCVDCGKKRWVVKQNIDRGSQLRCLKCHGLRHRGSNNHNWKGGRDKATGGYITILLRKDSPFYPMVNSHGYVYEHRLVMAKHLGRPLLRTEIVHHRPDVAKDDNRIEVLYLMPNPSDHRRLSPCSNCGLKKDIRLLRWQVKELQVAIQGKLPMEIDK